MSTNHDNLRARQLAARARAKEKGIKYTQALRDVTAEERRLVFCVEEVSAELSAYQSDMSSEDRELFRKRVTDIIRAARAADSGTSFDHLDAVSGTHLSESDEPDDDESSAPIQMQFGSAGCHHLLDGQWQRHPNDEPCSDALARFREYPYRVQHTLIVGGPGSGKTSLAEEIVDRADRSGYDIWRIERDSTPAFVLHVVAKVRERAALVTQHYPWFGSVVPDRMLVVLDDVDYSGPAGAKMIELVAELLRLGGNAYVSVVVVAESSDATHLPSDLIDSFAERIDTSLHSGQDGIEG